MTGRGQRQPGRAQASGTPAELLLQPRGAGHDATEGPLTLPSAPPDSSVLTSMTF